MASWLFKTEPSSYSYADLAEAGREVWDGVANAAALKHLRAVARGDEVFLYHSGEERAVVGLARAASDPYADGRDAAGKLVVVDLEPVRLLPRPVRLAEIKADPAFREFDLVRISRLSVMPVPRTLRDRLCAMAGL